MSCCLKIELRENPDYLPDWVRDSHGIASFDMSPETKFSRTAKSSTLSEIDKITTGAAMGFSLPKTEKNKAILTAYGNPQQYGYSHRDIIPVRIIEGSRVATEDYIRVLRVTAKGYEVEIFSGDSIWLGELEGYRICQFNFDPFILTEANLIANWQAPIGAVQYRFPLVNYGNWSHIPAVYDDDGNITQRGRPGVGDFRPWIHVYDFLKNVFCDIGWEFHSPVLETAWGRRIISYTLGDLNTRLEKYRFRAVVEEDYWGDFIRNGASNPPGYDDASNQIKAYDDHTQGYDNGGIPGFYFYDAVPVWAYNFHTKGLSGRFKFKFRIIIDTSDDNTLRYVQFRINVTDGTTFTDIPGSVHLIGNPYGGGVQTIEGEIETDVNPALWYTFILDEELSLPGHFGPIMISSNSGFGFFKVLAGSEIWVEPVSVLLQEEALILPDTLMDCNTYFLDFLKGVLHLIGRGRIETDAIRKVVTIYHPDPVTIWGEERPEAYYFPENRAISIEDGFQCKSEIAAIRTGISERYYEIGFKSTSDSYCRREGYSGDIQPYRKRIDFGGNKGLSEETKTDLNPYFEPTLTAADMSLAHPIPTGAPVIPMCWDNDSHEISADISPRIMYWAGLRQQVAGAYGGSVMYAGWYLGVTPQNSVPMAFHIHTGTVAATTITNPAFNIPENVVYGDVPIDLYRLFWRRQIIELERSFLIEIAAYARPETFYRADFRSLRIITYIGKRFLARLTAIEGYRPCETAPARLTLQPVVYDEDTACDPTIIGN